ncbi:pyrimidine/purine nucleoside phosphorylase [Alteromonas sp. 5E99-2]|uniref:pyrimidine/purine nucleoside phosphorylase n=1 Tax=Alteromonas sp. 5E99-2 TaxID=2817683 RepID=UPI001A99AE88|nr:pyrimidine/purine nucleoside phosphorylase [Alteromonas sp. 5E99-2]MBO1254490.1 pyrimidine/purine nucleoside phosphorylase [Alteromonas sp. 5E99-2]
MIKHSEYFEGQVQSLSVEGHDKPATLGVMSVGDYKFGTDLPELMSVISGELQIQLAGSTQWNTYKKGESFNVDGDSSFLVKVPVTTAYYCIYG